MTPLTQSILAGIKEGIEEAFLGASETACAYAHSNFQPVEPYDTLLREQPPTSEDIEAIKNALLSYIASDQKMECAGPAFFALGKLCDPELIAVFRTHLEHQLRAMHKSNSTLGNLICALDGVGEPIISGQSFSISNVDENIENARRYLHKHGIPIPW